jgi:hypothetical protein
MSGLPPSGPDTLASPAWQRAALQLREKALQQKQQSPSSAKK